MVYNCHGLYTLLCLEEGFAIFSFEYLEIRGELGGNPYKGINGSLKFDSV